MADKIKLWFDSEGDFLEVRFNDAPGCMQATENDAVMERVDVEAKIIGFSVLGVSRFSKNSPLVAELIPH